MMSLKEKLQKIAAASASQIPEAAREIMHDSTQAVAASISGRSIPAVGDVLPSFELQDSQGNMVSSAELLSAGPLILTFFRGNW